MASVLGISWQKCNIHGRLLIYFLLESYRIIAFGQITNIHLKSDNDASYIGKVEIEYRTCYPVFGCSLQWYDVCHDGDNQLHSWNLKAATAACKQLGYEAGWNRSETGLTTEWSIEGVNCTDPSDPVKCTSDNPEYCGCSIISYSPFNSDRCDDHYVKDQAAVECYDFADVLLHLKDAESNEKKLEIEYRSELYDVCFHGASKDWSIHEADVACRQMGYPGALSTNELNLSAAHHLPRSFADFSCNGGESNLFSCISKPPRPNSCEDLVSLTCQGNRDGTETSTSSINTRTSEDFSSRTTDRTETSSINTRTSEDFSTGPTDYADGTETSSVSSLKNTDFSTRAAGIFTQDSGEIHEASQQQTNTGMIVGATVGVISVLLIIIVAVLCHVQYRRKTLLKRSTQSQHQQPASTTHPNNVYDAGSAEYAEVQDRVQDPNTDYAYAYSHVRNGCVSSTQPATDTTRITNQSGTNSEGWADNAAYNSYGDDGLIDHNSDGVVLRPSNLPAQNQTEGWAENDAYGARRSDDVTDRSRNDEGWQDNTVYVTN